MECEMSSQDAKSWSCEIQIRYEYDINGSKQPPKTVAFAPVLKVRKDVDLWIRRAQAAVLSPHRSPSDFHTMSEAALKANANTDKQILKFSKNVVQVRVKDPDITDLNFVDLPGRL